MILEHLKIEAKRTFSEKTYKIKKCGLKKFFILYIGESTDISSNDKFELWKQVDNLFRSAPDFNVAGGQAEGDIKERNALDHVFSNLLYCGMLLDDQVKFLMYAFMLQTIHAYDVFMKFFSELTFDDLASISRFIELVNLHRAKNAQLSLDDFYSLNNCFSVCHNVANLIRLKRVQSDDERLNELVVNLPQ